MGTDKRVLLKGVQILAISLLVGFVSIYLISFSFVNKFYTVTVLGVLLMFFTIYLIFKGINTIMKSIFGK